MNSLMYDSSECLYTFVTVPVSPPAAIFVELIEIGFKVCGGLDMPDDYYWCMLPESLSEVWSLEKLALVDLSLNVSTDSSVSPMTASDLMS